MESVQLDLFEFQRNLSPEALRDQLAADLPGRLDVSLTSNRVSMITADFSDHRRIKLRMHRHFLHAPESVLRALAIYLRTRQKKHWTPVAEFAQTIPRQAAKKSMRRLPTRGKVYDLKELFRETNKRYFNGNATCSIGWGRGPSDRIPKRRCSMSYGSYDASLGLIRINPLLDDPRVPREFITYIIFHEILHSIVPAVRQNGRWLHHPPAFRKLEKSFPRWDAMQKMADEMIVTLTHQRRTARWRARITRSRVA